MGECNCVFCTADPMVNAYSGEDALIEQGRREERARLLQKLLDIASEYRDLGNTRVASAIVEAARHIAESSAVERG